MHSSGKTPVTSYKLLLLTVAVTYNIEGWFCNVNLGMVHR